jgi:uncharacterized protein (DUF1499 family)
MSATEGKVKSLNWIALTGVLLVLLPAIWVGLRIALPDTPTFFAGSRPDRLGVSAGKLATCPSTPNCVSSQSTDAEHYIEPIAYQSSPTDVIEKLKAIVEDLDRAKLVAETDRYLYAEFTSPWMGFVDDVEFYVDRDKKVIDVRSASRLGESDLGVNRQRLESIREKIEAM